MTIHDVRRTLSRKALDLLARLVSPMRRAEGPLPDAGIHRILVCRVTHTLGNTLLLTPLIRELEEVFPGAEIDILTRSPVANEIFGRFFAVRRIAVLPAHAFAHPLRFRRVLRGILGRHYDLVIDPCPRSITGRILAMRARGTCKLGFESAKKGAGLTHAVSTSSMPVSTGQQPVFLLREALGKRRPMRVTAPDIALDHEERQAGRDALGRIVRAGSQPSRVIGVFANATGGKYLGDAWWHRFTPALERRFPGHRIVEVVPATAKPLLGDRYPTYYASDIRKLASVLSAFECVISSDCGVMHLACASGVPVTAIFSTTDPAEWGPYGERDHVIWAQGMEPEDVALAVRLPVAGHVRREMEVHP